MQNGIVYKILWEHREKKKEIVQLEEARQGFTAELTIIIATVYCSLGMKFQLLKMARMAFYDLLDFCQLRFHGAVPCFHLTTSHIILTTSL